MASKDIYETHLEELGKSSYEIAEGDSDIRGWTVKNESGKILGTVNDLIFDTKAKKVKYLILDLNGNELYLQARKVLLPLEVARLDEVYKNAIYPGLMAAELTSLPSYEKGKVTAKLETLVSNAFAARHHSSPAGSLHSAHADYESRVNTGSSSDLVSPQPSSFSRQSSSTQTVIGVFEHINQAQAAAQYLDNQGFDRAQVDISYKDASVQEDIHNRSVSNFFSSLFSNEDEERGYSEAAKRYAVIKVQAASNQEAELVAEILDKHGALNMDDHIRNDDKIVTASGSKKYRSRIIDRPGENDSVRWS